MKKIEAPTLEEAYRLAALEFGCSVTELDVEVAQQPTSGFLGIFKKTAIVFVTRKEPTSYAPPRATQRNENAYKTEQFATDKTPLEKIDLDETELGETFTPTLIAPKARSERREVKTVERDRHERPSLKPSVADRLIDGAFADEAAPILAPEKTQKADLFIRAERTGFTLSDRVEKVSRAEKSANWVEKSEKIEKKERPKTPPIRPLIDRGESFGSLDLSIEKIRQKTQDYKVICEQIETTLRNLFAQTSYKIDTITATMYDDKTVRVFFDGEDAALMIGKDGYRYKALSYILFNWINPTFGYLLRLEIAEFLQNQEDMIARYLEPLITQIEESGKGQTRVLDGVLVQIALKELRLRFPEKYVGIKTAQDGEGKYVVVNDFIRRF
ncbi:MAG: Jag N-terminal domain-containing protein [Helicobacteraceae bacterium]|jgi:spoIIIJ-associated protein|nr:Jag N-terminal domain-containing protein [Helicobacteraceae bacterium]